jgi:hypothetical protein
MAKQRSRIKIAFFVAIMATALALGGALAHAFELPNKMLMSRADYFVTQQAYRGWNMLAAVLVVQLASMLWLASGVRRERRIFATVLAAILCLVAAQIIFWIWTYPANVATDNWTRIPEDWADLRRQWEYSHAAGALFQLGAMAALIVAALSRSPD